MLLCILWQNPLRTIRLSFALNLLFHFIIFLNITIVIVIALIITIVTLLFLNQIILVRLIIIIIHITTINMIQLLFYHIVIVIVILILNRNNFDITFRFSLIICIGSLSFVILLSFFNTITTLYHRWYHITLLFWYHTTWIIITLNFIYFILFW